MAVQQRYQRAPKFSKFLTRDVYESLSEQPTSTLTPRDRCDLRETSYWLFTRAQSLRRQWVVSAAILSLTAIVFALRLGFNYCSAGSIGAIAEGIVGVLIPSGLAAYALSRAIGCSRNVGTLAQRTVALAEEPHAASAR